MDWPLGPSDLGPFFLSLTALLALSGGFLGARIARRRARGGHAALGAGIGAAAAVLLCIALQAYFGSLFIGLLIVAAFALFSG